MTQIVEGMKDVEDFQGVVSMPRWKKPMVVEKVSRCLTLEKYLSKATTDKLSFVRVDFADPFLIVYSSGVRRREVVEENNVLTCHTDYRPAKVYRTFHLSLIHI